MGEIEGAIFDIFYKTSLRKSDGTVGEADLRNYLKSNKKDLFIRSFFIMFLFKNFLHVRYFLYSDRKKMFS